MEISQIFTLNGMTLVNYRDLITRLSVLVNPVSSHLKLEIMTLKNQAEIFTSRLFN
jgi:hypothetical protein